MPVVGIYTKDFPIYPGTLSDSTIIIVTDTGNAVTYRSTIGALRSRFCVSNATTSELSIASLNVAYPNAGIGFEVICESIAGNPLIYKKGVASWFSIPLGTIA